MFCNSLRRVYCCIHLVKNHAVLRTSTIGYKSQYNLENLYPNSSQNFFQVQEIKHTYTSDTEEPFSGHIPLNELDIKYLKGSGPGGQNVNKVNTKVEIRFHLDSATWIPDWIKERLKEKEKGRMNKNGYFFIDSDKTRKQMLNQADCLDKIRTLIFEASYKREEPTPEFLQKQASRIAQAKAKNVAQKRRDSVKRQYRRGDM